MRKEGDKAFVAWVDKAMAGYYFFIVRGGELWTSSGAYSFKGITQRTVLVAWRAAGGTARECDFTLAQVYSASEAFVTGTLGGVTPVSHFDGRVIGAGVPGPVTARAAGLYDAAALLSAV